MNSNDSTHSISLNENNKKNLDKNNHNSKSNNNSDIDSWSYNSRSSVEADLEKNKITQNSSEMENEQEYLLKKELESVSKLSIDEIVKIFSDNSNIVAVHDYFGLRVKKNGEWIDQDLASHCMSLLATSQIDEMLKFVLLFAYFLIDYQKRTTLQTLNDLTLTPELKESLYPFTNLVGRKLMSRNIT